MRLLPLLLRRRGPGREPNQQTSRLIATLNHHAFLLPLLHTLVEERAGERRLPTGSWAGGLSVGFHEAAVFMKLL
jgi:hypothetical protein